MIRTFIEVPLFTKRWKEIGLDDKEIQRLQVLLLKDPQSGPVMEGTGGIRKVRFPLENRGKSSSIRGLQKLYLFGITLQTLQSTKSSISLLPLKKVNRKT